MIGEAEEIREPVWDFADILMFFGLGLPAFLVVFYISIAVLRIFGISAPGLRVLLPQFAGYLSALIPLYAIFRLRYDQSPIVALRMNVSVKDAGTSISLGILTAFAVQGVAVLLRTPSLKMPMEEVLRDTTSLIAATILGVTLGPWFEELVFRGLLQPLVGRYLGIIPAVVLASLPFALLHGPQYAWSWRHVLLIAMAGSAFGLRRYLTNSTGAAAVMHSAYNLVLFAALIAARLSGAEIPKPV